MEDISKTEMEIMLALWEHGPMPVRGIVEEVYHAHSQSLHTTVKSLLERLMRKGYIHCDRGSYPHVFSPTVDREAVARTQVEKIAANLYGGHVPSVLLSMVERVRLTERDRAIIESILEKLD